MANLLSDPLEFFVQLGALAGLIAFVYYFMRWQRDKSEKELEARIAQEKREHDARETREAFLEAMVTASNERWDKQMKSWQEVTTSTIETFKGFSDAVSDLAEAQREACDAILNGEKKAHQDRIQIYSDLDGVTRAVVSLQETVIETRGEIIGRMDR